MTENMNRRRFFGSILKVTGVAFVAPAALNSLFSSSALAQKKRGAPAAAGGETLPLLSPNDPTAKAVSYIEDYTKAPKAAGNRCTTCSFYVKKEVRDGREVGTCTIFAGKVVIGNGWCGSWNKKA